MICVTCPECGSEDVWVEEVWRRSLVRMGGCIRTLVEQMRCAKCGYGWTVERKGDE